MIAISFLFSNCHVNAINPAALIYTPFHSVYRLVLKTILYCLCWYKNKSNLNNELVIYFVTVTFLHSVMQLFQAVLKKKVIETDLSGSDRTSTIVILTEVQTFSILNGELAAVQIQR